MTQPIQADMTIEDLHKKILYSVVRVRTGKAGGSGTVLYSEPKPDNTDEFETYVLTNWHVIDDAIKITKKWDALKGRKVRKEHRKTVNVETFEYEYMSNCIGGLQMEADIVCWSQEDDLALLELRTDREIEHVAKLYPRKESRDLKLFQPTICTGCSLGHTPIPTYGRLTGKTDEIEDKVYFMSTSQSIFGNSGGAMFLPDGSLIGVPARISALKLGFGTDVITHMGFFIPIDRVYDFLEENIFDFIWKDKTSKECREERERKKKEEEKKLIVEEIERPEREPEGGIPKEEEII